MQISVETRPEGRAIVRLDGQLDLLSTTAVKQHLLQTINNGDVWLVVDMSRVSFVDSSGLAALISGLKAARMAGGGMHIASPGEEVQNILEFTRIDRVMPISPTLEESLEKLVSET
jgi:anti-anti-sigma factor